MTHPSNRPAQDLSHVDFLHGGGEMGRYIRSKDWSRTPLGPIDFWPQSLRTTVSLCLASNFPINIAWGPEFTQIYNDGYWPLCGEKHPHSMGQDYRICWASAWPVLSDAFDRAVRGETSYLENQRMFLDRKGYLEETFFTFSFSPIRDESGNIGGLFHPVTEQTEKMLSERRTRALRDVASRSAKAKSITEVFELSAQTLSEYNLDLPFILFYQVEDTKNVLVGSSGFADETLADAQDLSIDDTSVWPFDQVFKTGLTVEVNNLKRILKDGMCGPYPEAPDTAFLMPVKTASADAPKAFFIAGVSSRLPLDDAYRGFYDLLVQTVSAAVINAQAYEDERKRAEALAEIDRAKTAFFSNVSHEFRTPLTLMLGPLEEAIKDQEGSPESLKLQLDLAYRNALRLQKLVNTLLDFSRIEAGRVEAVYEPTNLAESTVQLCSMFESAIQKAGLNLEIDCPPLPEPVYVDQDMWEKVILNLLSNALKHTFKGTIRVRQHWCTNHIELTIQDTGIGIEPHQLPHIFERFHRVANARSRTHEGSGIGLALVSELVKLHGGEITVTSEAGKGTAFRVSIPAGKAHLPAARIGSTATLASTHLGASPFVLEALRWIPDTEAESATVQSDPNIQQEQHLEWRGIKHGGKAIVLLTDDNADMRSYVKRILTPFCTVMVAGDGEAALRIARENMPDLILSDIMMPKMDGFELLEAIRSDAALKTIPVILLSARAGEEARIEGLQAGADDYLTKPFNARELLARVKTNLDLYSDRYQQTADALAESEERFRTLADQVPAMVYMSDLQGHVTYWNKHWLNYTGLAFEESRDLGWKRAAHPEDYESLLAAYRHAASQMKNYSLEARIRRSDGMYRWFMFTGGPRYLADGTFAGYAGTGIDMNDRKEAKEQLEKLFNERTVELRRSNEDLQQFAHVASHDLKEPTRKIKTFVSRLEDDSDSVLSDKGKLYLQKVQSAADRLFTMINGVLAYSTFTGSEEIREPVDLNAVIKDIETDLEIIIKQKNASIRYEQLPEVTGFGVLLYQLFYNLINNSLKFSRQEEAPVVTITASFLLLHGEKWVQLVLSDNGIGFKQEESKKIFGTFTRLNSKDKYEGTGLGLALCKKIVDRHGGTIRASGEPESGAVFTITLPATRYIADNIQAT